LGFGFGIEPKPLSGFGCTLEHSLAVGIAELYCDWFIGKKKISVLEIGMEQFL
jgi:hypothetical protein